MTSDRAGFSLGGGTRRGGGEPCENQLADPVQAGQLQGREEGMGKKVESFPSRLGVFSE